MYTLAFDESGNSGPHLLDPAQPVFALASVHLEDADARELVRGHAGQQAKELHYKGMRGSRKGRESILEILSSDLLTTQSARITLVHKRFMIAAKLVDNLLEGPLRSRGVDIYKGRRNIIWATELLRRGPLDTDLVAWESMLAQFVAAHRDQSGAAVQDLQSEIEACRSTASKGFVRAALGVSSRIADWTEISDYEMSSDDLDPAVTSPATLLLSWSQDVNGQMRVIHDDSKAVARWRDSLARVPAIGGRPAAVFDMSASHDAPSVQIADVLAGAAAQWCRSYLSDEKTDDFARELNKTRLPELVVWPLWPTGARPFQGKRIDLRVWLGRARALREMRRLDRITA